MPPRFRRAEPMTTFELVPDDELEDAPGTTPDEEPTDGRRRTGRRRTALRDRAVARWRALPRRGRVAVAAGTAVVVVAATAAAVTPGLLDARAERLRAEAVQGMPGVVGDLSDPVETTWSLPEGSSLAAVLPGGVLAVTGSDGVRAVDAATGDVVWEHPFDDAATCGPTPWTAVDWSAPVDSVVCVEDLSRVTVLDADGTVVSERELDLLEPVDAPGEDDAGVSSWSQVLPAAGRTVAVLDQESPVNEVPWREGDDAASLLRTLRDAGWHDPSLRIIDAVTGEVRAEVSVRLTEGALEECGVVEDGQGGRTVAPQPWVDATPSSTTLGLCGLTRAVTPTGESIDIGDDWQSLVAEPDGGYLVPGETSAILDAHGERRATIHGLAVTPTIDTEPSAPRLALLGADGSAPALAAFGTGDVPAWSVSIDPLTTPLARVGDTIVLADDSSVMALDARTGDRRWRLAGLLDADPEEGETVTGVVTDGTRLLLAISPNTWTDDDGAGVPRRLVALDLRDGSTTWERAGRGMVSGLFSADGNPVSVGSAVSGLAAP
ncbi:PQQ-binding-like beta-propeller repeat protein [Isoptericola sp. NPDC019482]|uniref:outer membrane protein assembly factor BamB family protein n=1 Tax=Isoptericola sp. NPDC019482 TaxID=3154688 RepID=UPI003473B6B9